MSGNAALYTAQPPPSAAVFRGMWGFQALETDETAGKITQYRVRFEHAHLTMNVMPTGALAGHLVGFQGFVRHLHAQIPSPHTDTIIAQLQKTQTVLGCVIEPDWDDAGQVQAALFTINELQDGLLFAIDTVFGATGEPLIGRLAADESE